MINFFRRIRKKLADDNPPDARAGKFSRYLLYAIGEIVLVVIGILIALQINNWNEQQKQNKLEKEYYCRFLEDVLQDREQVTNLIAQSESRLKASNQAVRLLQKEKTKKEEIGTQISLSIRAIYADFKPNNSAFEDLKSGANLNIIRDNNVIKALNNYFNKVESFISVIKVNGENAVAINFSHQDNFANGWVEAYMSRDRFLKGMEQDVYEAITLDNEGLIDKDMKIRLYNDALYYISFNARQIELYNFIKNEIDILTKLLETKCTIDND